MINSQLQQMMEAEKRLIDKDKPIVVYCHHGLRSHYACELLRGLGYEHVFNLIGGIDSWADKIEWISFWLRG